MKSSFFFILFLLVGCAQQPVDDFVADEIVKVKEGYQHYLEKKPSVPVASKAIVKQEQKPEKRFSISANDLSAKNFFLNLMIGSGENIVVHPEVDGLVTLKLQEVTLSETLKVVRDIFGYEYKRTGSVYTIFPNKLISRSFLINYIDVKRVGISDTSILTGNIESNNANTGDSSQQVDFLGTGGGIVPGSRVQTKTETDFWYNLETAVKQIVGVVDEVEGETPSKNPEKVIVNPQAGVLVVTALPLKLLAVENFLESVKLSINRQVVIEAKIMEVELSEQYQSGINWDEINGQLLLANNVSEFDTAGNIVTVTEATGEVFSSLIKITNISRLLSLLEQQGNVQVLSSPRVSTLNNQKAVIRVGSDQFFVTGISNSTTTSSGGTTTSPDIELTSFFSGISLDVTPQIAENGEIILHIHPVISEVKEEQKDIVVGNDSFSLPLALRDIRESDSVVKARDGQLIVLGGLMQQKSTNINSRRPGISRLPLAGSLFKSKNKLSSKSELIILLRPTVIQGDQWYQDIEASSNRFGTLRE